MLSAALFLVLSQTAALAGGDPSRGLTLPPTSAALVDEATAALLNPAGLRFLGGPELIYQHERNVAQSSIGDGLYLGTSLLDFVGLGVSVEWLRGSAFPAAYHKTTWSLALGNDDLSVGAGLNFYGSAPGQDLNALTGLSLGLQSRPSRFLAVGASVQNVDAQSYGAVTFGRRFDLSAGLRPLGDRFSLAVDYLWGAIPSSASGRLQYTLSAEPFHGVVLGAGISHGFQANEDLLLQISVTLSTPHLGGTYALGGSSAGLDHVLQVRLSKDAYNGLGSTQSKIALFDVAGWIHGGPGPAAALLGLSGEDPYVRFISELDRASQDGRLAGVVLKIDTLSAGLGHIQEMREAIFRLRASGKRVVAVILNAHAAEHWLATAADRVYVVPQALLLLNGLAAHSVFLGTTMDKLGVDWDVAKVGAYKNAPDALTRSSMTDEQREAINAYLDTDVHELSDDLARSRQVSPPQLQKIWAQGLMTPHQAKDLGLVDDVVVSEGLVAKLKVDIPGAGFDPSYSPDDRRRTRWGPGTKVAVVPVIGDIAGGKSGEDPFGVERIAGAESVVQALKQAEEDTDVGAIVLRVDSGGGDGLASDLIYRQVLETRKKKPVIASMGNVAASGGYYVAMGAHEIWAEPTTITGSIGVFVLKPALQRLAQRVGVHRESLRRGDLADVLDLYARWTPEERQAAQRWVDAFYDGFITEVAQSRKLDKGAVDKVARGRVWSGADAKSRGLVDHLGGLLPAIEAARAKANIHPEDLVVEVVGAPKGSLPGMRQAAARLLGVEVDRQDARPGVFGMLARELGLDPMLLAAPGLQAVMPYTLDVE